MCFVPCSYLLHLPTYHLTPPSCFPTSTHALAIPSIKLLYLDRRVNFLFGLFFAPLYCFFSVSSLIQKIAVQLTPTVVHSFLKDLVFLFFPRHTLFLSLAAFTPLPTFNFVLQGLGRYYFRGRHRFSFLSFSGGGGTSYFLFLPSFPSFTSFTSIFSTVFTFAPICNRVGHSGWLVVVRHLSSSSSLVIQLQ